MRIDRIDPDRNGFWNLDIPPLAWLAVAGLTILAYAEVERLRGIFWVLDGCDLIIHEAGHPIFSLLGLGNRFIMFIGGTAMQLLVPLVFHASFLSQSKPRSADACLIWFGQNFLHIAPYIADARAQALPLIGGGEHDWDYLLGVFGLLKYDARLGHLCDFAGCSIMVFALLCLFLRGQRGSGSRVIS